MWVRLPTARPGNPRLPTIIAQCPARGVVPRASPGGCGKVRSRADVACVGASRRLRLCLPSAGLPPPWPAA